MRKRIVKITKATFGKDYDELDDKPFIGEYKIREWTFGEKEDILELASEQNVGEDGKIKFSIKSSKYRILQLLTCVRKAPKKVTEEFIRSMPNSVASLLNSAVEEVNKDFSDEEEKK